MGLFEMVFGLFSFIYYRFISFNLIRFWLYFILFLTSPFFAPFPYQKLKRHAYLTATVFCDPISIPGYVYGGFVAFLQNGGNKYPAVALMVLLVAVPLLFTDAILRKKRFWLLSPLLLS